MSPWISLLHTNGPSFSIGALLTEHTGSLCLLDEKLPNSCAFSVTLFKSHVDVVVWI